MKYDLSNVNEQQIAYNQFNHLLKNERLIDIKEIKKTRTTLQNASLHMFFNIISDELNNLGMEFTYQGLKVDMTTRYTPDIVKKYIFRPMMIDSYNIKSTTKINSNQINELADVLIKWFGEKGIYISFPSIQNLIYKQDVDRETTP